MNQRYGQLTQESTAYSVYQLLRSSERAERVTHLHRRHTVMPERRDVLAIFKAIPFRFHIFPRLRYVTFLADSSVYRQSIPNSSAYSFSLCILYWRLS